MAKQFNGEYVVTKVLGEMSDGRVIELGHYIDKDSNKEFKEKIYLRTTYTKKNGEESTKVTSTQLTLADLSELQKLDLSGFDLDNPNEAFD